MTKPIDLFADTPDEQLIPAIKSVAEKLVPIFEESYPGIYKNDTEHVLENLLVLLCKIIVMSDNPDLIKRGANTLMEKIAGDIVEIELAIKLGELESGIPDKGEK